MKNMFFETERLSLRYITQDNFKGLGCPPPTLKDRKFQLPLSLRGITETFVVLFCTPLWIEIILSHDEQLILNGVP